LLVCCGYLFGKLPMVQDNFALVIVAIIALSFIPVAFEYVRARLRR
jgi:membrane-associated protein